MIISKKEFLKNPIYLKKILAGAVFIYPTDTIYGIGCIATNAKSVRRIRSIKKRPTTPFSIAVPSKKWILENCLVKDKSILKKIPGKFTLVFPLKNHKAISREVYKSEKSIGVRIPKNWFSDVVVKINIPIVSTSANLHGEPNMASLDDLNPSVAKKVDFIIYEGKKGGRPSTIIDCTGQNPKIKKR